MSDDSKLPPEETAELSDGTIEAFLTVSTATITQILHKRGIATTFAQGLVAGRPDLRMVGVARTLRYTALRGDVSAQRVVG